MPKTDSATRKVNRIISAVNASSGLALAAGLADFLIPKENDPEVLKAVGRAFKAFRLNPENPDDHRKLICFFAFAHFGPRGKTGPKGPQKWDIEKRIKLGAQAQVAKEYFPNATNEEIAKLVKTRWSRPENVPTLLRYLNNPISGPRLKSGKDRP